MIPGSLPERISYGSVERSLQEIDLSAVYVRLEWNYEDEALHIFFMPYGAVTVAYEHYVWEQKSDAWWRDSYQDAAALSHQPTAVGVIDGDDPDDRRMIIGAGGNASLSSGDGYLFAWDRDKSNDDGVPIFSQILMGPFASSTDEVRLTSMTAVLAQDQGPATFRLFVTPTADTLGASSSNGTLVPGRNPRKRLRGRGSHVFLELTSGGLERWAFEEAQVEVYQAGRKRVRARP
jgi:hypothetical protein